jgi:hypothetical protein
MPAFRRLFSLCEKKRMYARKAAKPQRGFFFAPLHLCAPKKYVHAKPTCRRQDTKGLISLLLWKKKEVSAQRREDAKGFSLRLSVFARQKTNNSHQSAKGFSNFFASLRLCALNKKFSKSTAGRLCVSIKRSA